MKLGKYILSFLILFTVSIGFTQEKLESSNMITSDSLVNSVKEKVYLTMEATSDKVSVGDEIAFQYTLCVSHDIGISNWKLVEQPTYFGFDYKNVSIDQLEVKEFTLNGEPYRYVIIKKGRLKAIKKGVFEIAPLQLEVIAEVADKTESQNGLGFSMKKIKVVISSNETKIKVKS